MRTLPPVVPTVLLSNFWLRDRPLYRLDVHRERAKSDPTTARASNALTSPIISGLRLPVSASELVDGSMNVPSNR